MRRLLIAVAILVVVLVIGDFVAKAYATGQLRDRAKRAARGATSSSASISSFPFTARLLIAGQVQEARVRVGPVVAGRVTFASVSVDLNDVHVDRNKLINDRKVRLTSIGSGTVTAEITDAELSRLAGVQLSSTPGQIRVRARGTEVTGQVSATGGNLLIEGEGGAALHLRVPRAPLFPCDATKAVPEQGKIVVSCTIDRVPPELSGVTVHA